MHCFCRLLAASAIVVLPWTSTAAADPSAHRSVSTRPLQSAPSWPQFLGPRRDGISRETGLNVDWRAKRPQVLWKVPLGGGFSSMAIVDGRLFTMARRGQRDMVFCLDATTGKEVWNFDAAPAYVDRERQGNGPRATPTYDDGRIYCLLPAGELFCLEAAGGRVVWKINAFTAAGTRFGGNTGRFWGLAGSPLVEGDLLIVQPGGRDDNSLVAFDKRTGRMVWGAGGDPPGYGSPIAITACGRRQIIGTTGNALIGVDPADGKLLWRYPWGRFNCNCATPLWTGGRLFISSAYGAGAALLEIVEQGDGLAIREVWTTLRLQNHFPNSMIVDGYVYGCHGDLSANTLRCLELATGSRRWVERKPGKCSLLAVQGHLICVSETGTIRLLEANPERYVEKGEIDGLLTRKTWAAPVLLDRRLYVRDEKHLVCLDLGAE